MGFRLTKYVGLDKMEGCDRYALEYGPVLLALIGSDSARLKVKGSPDELVKLLREDEFHPLHFHIDGHPEWSYIPYWKVLTEPFTCYPGVIEA
jgi:hypothetical protein